MCIFAHSSDKMYYPNISGIWKTIKYKRENI